MDKTYTEILSGTVLFGKYNKMAQRNGFIMTNDNLSDKTFWFFDNNETHENCSKVNYFQSDLIC